VSIAPPPIATARPRPRAAAGRAARIPWGWPEAISIGLFAVPALMFVPGASSIRFWLRTVVYVLPLLAWVSTLCAGKRARRTSPGSWMKFCAAWTALSLCNPLAGSLIGASAQLVLTFAIYSAVFWVPATVTTAPRLARLLGIFFLCNAASSVMGILQFYYPERFNPPVLQTAGKYGLDPYIYVTADGREVIRPCGLSDSPGGASAAGLCTSVMGVAFALWPMARWKRLACAGLALVGMAVIYTTNVRSALVLALIGQLCMAGILALRRDFVKLSQLGMIAGLIFVAALAWAIRNGGQEVVNRFASLLEGSAGEVYYQNRGHFLENAFTKLIFDYPVGAGLGRWGMMAAHFNPGAALWAEIQVQAWILDGGIPLLIGYAGGIVVSLAMATRLAIRSRDRALRYAAMIIAVLSLMVAFLCLSYVPFCSTLGVQFWILIGGLAGVKPRPPARGRAATATAGPPSRPGAP
jgi:hypothetical protein